jgi:hypothetical protein
VTVAREGIRLISGNNQELICGERLSNALIYDLEF